MDIIIPIMEGIIKGGHIFLASSTIITSQICVSAKKIVLIESGPAISSQIVAH